MKIDEYHFLVEEDEELALKMMLFRMSFFTFARDGGWLWNEPEGGGS